MATQLRKTASQMHQAINTDELKDELEEYFWDNLSERLLHPTWVILRRPEKRGAPFYTAAQGIGESTTEEVNTITTFVDALRICKNKDHKDNWFIFARHGLRVCVSGSKWKKSSLCAKLEFCSLEHMKQALGHFSLHLDFTRVNESFLRQYDRSRGDFADAEKDYVNAHQALTEWRAFKQEIKVL